MRSDCHRMLGPRFWFSHSDWTISTTCLDFAGGAPRFGSGCAMPSSGQLHEGVHKKSERSRGVLGSAVRHISFLISVSCKSLLEHEMPTRVSQLSFHFKLASGQDRHAERVAARFSNEWMRDAKTWGGSCSKEEGPGMVTQWLIPASSAPSGSFLDLEDGSKYPGVGAHAGTGLATQCWRGLI